MNIKEKEIEHQILTWLNQQEGCFAFKVNTGGFFDPKIGRFRKNHSPFVIRGTADIIAVWEGLFIAIEVKTPIGLKKFNLQNTEHCLNQRAFLDHVKSKGGVAIVTDSLKNFKNELNRWVESAKAMPMPASHLSS